MNKAKSFYKLMVTLLCGVFMTLSFTGCIFDFSGGSRYGEILDCAAVAGDGVAVISWTMRGSSSVHLAAYVNGEVAFSVDEAAGVTNEIAVGLTNEIEYTFVVSNSRGEKSATVTPSVEEGSRNTYVANISSGGYVHEIPAGKTFVRILNAAGKTVEFANINMTDEVLDATYPRVLVDSTEGAFSDTQTHPEVAERYATVSSSRSVSVLPQEYASPVRHFKEPASIHIDAGSRSIAGYTDNFNIEDIEDGTVTEYEINRGDYYKYVWLDSNVNMDSYSVKKVTLRALGRDDSNALKCLVWVEDSCYRSSGTASGKYVTRDIARDIATRFARYCDHERAVFGTEANEFKDLNAPNDFATCCDTKEYVNIVIYDIGNDFGKSSQCGVAGYFYAKDYCGWDGYEDSHAGSISNKGKYFYVDSGYCNYNSASSDHYSGLGNAVSDTAVSTLFHEFQHMINYNMKYECKEDPAWYNEMLSMLAEDMMQDILGLSSEDSPRGDRLPTFNKYYWMSGVTDYLDGSNSILSYSSAYAFGAWVARTYGGPQLVSKMSRNDSVGLESVLAAIREQTGVSKTAEQLLGEYVQACMFRTEFANDASHSLPTFFRDGGTLTAEGQTSSITKINLFGENYAYYPFSNSNAIYYGPLLFTSTQKMSVRPTGFILHSIGTLASDKNDVMLVFTPQMYSDEDANRLFVYIQDSFSNTSPDTLSED